MTLIIISFLLIVISSLSDGITEGFEFDQRKSFERKFKVGPFSFFGSRSWDNKKGWWFRLTGGVWDFYHLGDDVRFYGYRIGGMMLGGHVIPLLIASGFTVKTTILILAWFALASLAKRAGLWWIRN